MSEIIHLEDNANILLKKLDILIDNLSFNLSKEKTEKALCDGNDCINEIENIIKQINNIKEENYSQNNLLMIKGDLMQKKEKYEKIKKSYIINKNNQLIDSFSSTDIQEEINNNIYEPNIDNLNDDIIFNITEEKIENKDDINDEIFQVNKESIELSEEYLYSGNNIYLAKRKINKFFIKLKNRFEKITIKTKYFIILIILIILLIACLFGLFAEFFNFMG